MLSRNYPRQSKQIHPQQELYNKKMKNGLSRIHDLPTNDITNLGVLAAKIQAEIEATGKRLPPPVRLHIGEPSFWTPEHINQAAREAIEREQMTYGPPVGWLWLRELLVEKVARVNGFAIGPEQLAITVGGTGAILAALLATVDVGDEVLMPDPHWPQYSMQLASCGATGVPYPLDPANEWLPDVAALEKLVTPRTRMLIINSPANPTGAVFPRALVEQLLAFAQRHDLYLLSDECYDQMLFEGVHTSPASLLSPAEFEQGRVISVYSFSKTYAMTGWRVGYVAASRELLKTISYVVDASCTNVSTLCQRAAQAALLGPQDCVVEMRNTYRRRRDLAVSSLQTHGRYLYTPHGAFYILIDVRNPHDPSRSARQFAMDLLRQRNVTVAPGSGFGQVAEHYIRVSLAGSDADIKRGILEICMLASI